jgi:cytochrome bd-type quinol oxidase subunit 2
MECPSCKSEATTLLRSAVSLQGVSFLKSVKGYFTCQHCGVLLRVTGYAKGFWLSSIPTVTILALFASLYPSVAPQTEKHLMIMWVVVILLISMVLAVGSWKYARIEVVRGERDSTTIPPA